MPLEILLVKKCYLLKIKFEESVSRLHIKKA